MERRYFMLRAVAVIYKILSILLLLFFVLSAVLGLIFSLAGSAFLADRGLEPGFLAGSVVIQVISALVAIVVGVIIALPFYAFGQMIDLFIAMEQNTRATSGLIEQQTGMMSAMMNQMRAAAVQPPPGPVPLSGPQSPRDQIGAGPR
jgi:hypothetical protein